MGHSPGSITEVLVVSSEWESARPSVGRACQGVIGDGKVAARQAREKVVAEPKQKAESVPDCCPDGRAKKEPYCIVHGNFLRSKKRSMR